MKKAFSLFILCLLAGLVACLPVGTGLVVVTATPALQIATATPVLNPSPTAETVLGNLESGECIVLNGVTVCDILNNSPLVGKPTAIKVYDGLGQRGRDVEVPPGWEYTFTDAVPGITRQQRPTGEQYSPSPSAYCVNGDCRYAINDIFGTLVLSTGRLVGANVDANQGYLAKVEYDFWCKPEAGKTVDNNALQTSVKVTHSVGGKVTQLQYNNPQSVAGFNENIWLLKSPNAGSIVIDYQFLIPYAVCKGDSYLTIRALHLYPLPASYGSPSDFKQF